MISENLNINCLCFDSSDIFQSRKEFSITARGSYRYKLMCILLSRVWVRQYAPRPTQKQLPDHRRVGSQFSRQVSRKKTIPPSQEVDICSGGVSITPVQYSIHTIVGLHWINAMFTRILPTMNSCSDITETAGHHSYITSTRQCIILTSLSRMSITLTSHNGWASHCHHTTAGHHSDRDDRASQGRQGITLTSEKGQASL